MLLDRALEILDSISLQLVNDDAIPLDKSKLISQLNALEEIKLSMQDQSMESESELMESKDGYIQEISRLNGILQQRRDLLQMIISAIENWNKQ